MNEQLLKFKDERAKILASKTPYEALFLLTTATPEEAKYQYFKLVKRFSPEREEEAFRTIRKAYEDLRDPASKAAVDVMLFTAPPGRVRFRGVSTSTVSQLKVNREIEALETQAATSAEAKKELLLALKQRAVILAKNSNWTAALKDLDRIEELEPGNDDVRDGRVFILSRQAIELADSGHYADAAHRWRRALRLDPNNSYILHNLAVCATLLLNKEEETRYWVETLRAWHRDLTERGDDPYLKNLILETHKRFGGRFLNLTGDEGLRAQVSLAPPPPDGTPRAMGDSSTVAKTRKPTPEAEPSRPAPPAGAPESVGLEAFKAQNWAGAVASFELHLKENPKDFEVMNKMAWALHHSNQANRAFATWQKMIQEDIGKELARESYVQAKLDTARALRRRMMVNPALVQLKDALKVVPDSAAVYQELAEIYNERQDWINASFYYEKAVELLPNDKGLRQQARAVKLRARSPKALK
ncbi:MAG: hypothetical protein HUU16_17325 [Candidatus Omnitrophica bacterium]|nr:hypothetical protein [bacterium]NUN97927.1 hypothetical protein [Candidatus Omnitrophota bacterium]